MPTKKWRLCLYVMWHIMSGSQKVRPVVSLASQGVFLVVLCVERDWHREYLPPFFLPVTDSDGASRLCRTRRQTHNKEFDFKTPPAMIHEGLPVGVVFVDLFITGTETTTTGTVYEQASTPKSTKSLHQVIESVSVTHARTHDTMLLSLQFFPPLLLLSSQ